MSRANTTAEPSFKVLRPHSEVTFTFSSSSTGHGPSAVISIPEFSRWTPSPHWHERYTEYICVKQGRLRLILNGEERVVTPDDGEQRIQPFVVHEFMRADLGFAEDQADRGDVVVEERNEPADGLKEVFFRNIFSMIQDSSRVFGRATSLQITLTSAAFDNFDVFVDGGLSWYVTHAIYATARIFGWIVGLRPSYDEYTPGRLRHIAAAGGSGQKPKVS